MANIVTLQITLLNGKEIVSEIEGNSITTLFVVNFNF